MILSAEQEAKLRELKLRADTIRGWWEPPTTREVLELLCGVLAVLVPNEEDDNGKAD